MASTIKEQLSRVADHIPGLRHRRNEMDEASKPVPTDNLKHRYANPAVLRKTLMEMGFKDKDITIFASESFGLSVKLPRLLTSKETIFKKFEDAKKDQRAPPKGQADEDDD
ncbi:hypothetical protein FHL15_000569 [Xylaria flabelliformis]|uniref:Uncharacterized protein n=1 Tax=Xylaria flabelliformis TaxID=2512241 RepID=A0A553IE66_9PEZI|nr:hypothetical protein FHL15_000569 [Xylaria flabelliformis]